MRGAESDSERSAQLPQGCLRFGGLSLDLDSCTLTRESGETISLTRGEFALLRAFWPAGPESGGSSSARRCSA